MSNTIYEIEIIAVFETSKIIKISRDDLSKQMIGEIALKQASSVYRDYKAVAGKKKIGRIWETKTTRKVVNGGNKI